MTLDDTEPAVELSGLEEKRRKMWPEVVSVDELPAELRQELFVNTLRDDEPPRFYLDHQVPKLEAAPPGDGAKRRPRLYFTIGCARSGKSTFARRWLRRENEWLDPEHRSDGYPRAVWNTDSLRLRTGGRRYSRTVEPINYTIKYYSIGALLDYGHDVLVDGTHTTEWSIRNLLQVDIDAVPLVFPTPEDECIRRAHATGQSDLVPVIQRHSRQLRALLAEGVGEVMERLRREVTR